MSRYNSVGSRNQAGFKMSQPGSFSGQNLDPGQSSLKSEDEQNGYNQATNNLGLDGRNGSVQTPYPADNISMAEMNSGSSTAGRGIGVHSTAVSHNAKVLETLFQHQKSHASSLTSASTANRPRLSQQWARHQQQTPQQQQKLQQNQDPRSALVTLIPTSANPTEMLAQRFAAWRAVIKSILVYLSETVSIQDEIVRQQVRLARAVNFPFFATENQHLPSTPEEKAIQRFFLPLGSGSVQDLPSILTQYHSQLAGSASRMSKELANDVIPRLEELRRDLLVKIKEIKTLHSDFKNSCAKELHQTKSDMKQFQEAIESSKFGSMKNDPYLFKIVLDKQIKKQLTEENFLHEAFNNLQGSGQELEKVVVMEIQNALTIYARLLGQNAQVVFDVLISKLDLGFFNKSPTFEWDSFISNDENFISPTLPMRHARDIKYKHQNDTMIYEVKSGILERRSKFLKSYSRGYYVLTSNFLHEFKSADRRKDLIPVMSLALSDCSVAEHSKKGSSEHKFILHAKQNGIIHRGHNWVFRAESHESMMSWFSDLKALTSTSNPNEKSKFVIQKLNLTSDGKQRRISSLTQQESISENQKDRTPTSGAPQGPMSTPNLDVHTNTNTSVSIPETDYGGIPVVQPPRASLDGGQRVYNGNIYIETAGGKMQYPKTKT
ncbi:LAMI_0E04346g1_1 [Lachancea mirantina]|uniref:LAMI_0E04346g1_1 n=1 Tax=Lachancea mirantina TaxID=1230905 RepID=A0A1G4JKT5_9SACH|nr:LAMI_0E04346g1_1 [Lachancea mirantina]